MPLETVHLIKTEAQNDKCWLWRSKSCVYNPEIYTEMSRTGVGNMAWFRARLFETQSEVHIRWVLQWGGQTDLTPRLWHGSERGIRDCGVRLALSFWGSPAAVKQWLTTESAHHKENYRGLRTKAKTWVQPDSAIHVISFFCPQKRTKKERKNRGLKSCSQNYDAAAPARLQDIQATFSWEYLKQSCLSQPQEGR